SPSWTAGMVADSGTKDRLEADLHSTGPNIEETISVPCPNTTRGRNTSNKIGKTFLISPLLQAGRRPHESLSAVASQCGENPEPPGTIQNRCPNRARGGPGARRAIGRKSASSAPVPLVSENFQASEPSFRSSCPHSRRKTRSFV